MDATLQAVAGLEIPMDDGSIARAMADLNAKLSAWSAALTRAGRARAAPVRLPAATKTRACPVVARPAQAAAVCGTQPGDALQPYFGHIRVACETAAPLPGEAAATEMSNGDEALLASLDTDSANAIRIQRRLCGAGVPIGELVKLHQEQRLATAVEPKRSGRFWRKRGNS